jgi:DNA-binding MarR family transcriptional regulator
MTGGLNPLVFDLVEWIAREPRPYREVIEAWRTSCPRLTVWEDAVDRGLVERREARDGCVMVSVTPAGRAFLRGENPQECGSGTGAQGSQRVA